MWLYSLSTQLFHELINHSVNTKFENREKKEEHFPEPRVMHSNVLFCPTNSPNPKDIPFTLKENKNTCSKSPQLRDWNYLLPVHFV